MNRREIFSLTAAAAALPLPAFSAQTVAAVSSPAWQPQVLDPHQNATVAVLADLIIPATGTPGAIAANVNRYIDLLLRDGTSADRHRFLEGLSWLDGHSLRLHKNPFKDCPRATQVELLTSLDGAQDPALAPGASFFRSIKSLTTRTYYATEIGFRELNKGGRVPSTYGCTHPEHG